MALDAAGLGLRVAQARQRAGLTQDELARQSDLDRSAVAKIETGARRVTALELARLAMVVDERVEWFVSEPPPSIVSHRNMADPGEPSPRIDAAIERAARAVEFVAEHDSRLQASLRDLGPFTGPADAEQTEELAESTRALLGLGSDGPLYDLSSKLSEVGVLSFVVDLGGESADAGSVALQTGAVAVVNGGLRTGRRRLALAHEFGHVLVADPYTVDWRIDSGSQDVRERLLDRFARALLLPRASLTSRWREWGGDHARGLRTAAVRTASHFRVDMSTLARRLLDLRLAEDEMAARVRMIKTGRADIVEHDLLVADELRAGELPREYAAAVLRLYGSEIVSAARALDLLLDTWELDELPALPSREDSEIWQFVS